MLDEIKTIYILILSSALFIIFIAMAFALNSTTKKMYEYKRRALENMESYISYGEILLISIFQEMFAKNAIFEKFVIYHHLEFRDVENGKKKDRFKQVDFLVVSPKGVYVIESKAWDGITFIYNKQDNIFSTISDKLNSFRTDNNADRNKYHRSNLDICIFNANVTKSNPKTHKTIEVTLVDYGNPITQARGYSNILVQTLPVDTVKNIVAFSVCDGREVIYDGAALEQIVDIDIYTKIMTDKHIPKYFAGLPDINYNIQETIEYIENNLKYLFKMDINRYNQAPFDLLRKQQQST